MSLIKRFIGLVLLLATAAVAGFVYWARQPITGPEHPTIPFTVKAGSSVRSSVRQIADAKVPVNPLLLGLLARISGNASRLKAGSYEMKPGTSPLELIGQLVRGEVAEDSLAIIEGWTFHQMRQAIDADPSLRHDTAVLSDRALLQQVAPDYPAPEGLFFPDTYLFAKGTSDLEIYKRAHALLQKRLDEAWQRRMPGLPYKSPYEALIMASIIEKETGQSADRARVAAVFVNRLKRGMLLQTDPTVIYGMGDKYHGNIRKHDLESDTPYNTYLHPGLPPTPIALPGEQSLIAALNPAQSEALYFVSRGNGTTEFSDNLNDHNRAVNKYQR